MLKVSVRSLMLFICLTTVMTSTLNAQSTQWFKINVPFSFVLNGRTHPAGEYVLERTDPGKPNIVTLKNVKKGIVRLILTQRVEKDRPSTASSLVFIQRDGKRFLFQIWSFGTMNGSQIPSEVEKESIAQQRKNLTLVMLRAKVH